MRRTRPGWTAAALLTVCASAAAAQQPPAPTHIGPPDWSAVKRHTDRARALGGELWAPVAAYHCVPGQRPNDLADKNIEPVKLFDNVYAIGDEGTVVYVVDTPEGLVLIDAGYPQKMDTVTLPGLAKLGLDPARVKYVLVTHGHADHYGAARYFQERNGARVAIHPKDWDVMARAAPEAVRLQPRRDIDAQDGQAIMIGGMAFTPVDTPGHTPGSMGYIFPVQDAGRTRMAGLFGSAYLTTTRITEPGMREHLAGLQHFAALARRLKVEVELQNHPLFDGMWERVAKLKVRAPGEPHPLVVGEDGYRRYIGAWSECLKANIARKGGTPPA